jgi:hypothetical protein
LVLAALQVMAVATLLFHLLLRCSVAVLAALTIKVVLEAAPVAVAGMAEAAVAVQRGKVMTEAPEILAPA